MKKIMVLGAGSCQLNLIKRIKEKGHKAIVTGYYKDSPGKQIADISVLADTFSYEETLKAAKKYKIDGIITAGTDQPVLTAARVAEKLGLPSFLNAKIAYQVTNKKEMKRIFKENNIKATAYAIIKKDYKNKDINHLKAPIVLKPLDSQGQRGIFKLDSLNEIDKYIDKTLIYSRSDEVLVEEYYQNKELTVSGWVENGNVKIFTITDRVTFNNELNIGICKSHEYPSIHLKDKEDEIIEITKKICKAFKINKGPIYFQMLVGKDGILVNEIACRLGGAYEDITIPLVTNINILDMLIEGCLNEEYNKKQLKKYNYSKEKLCISTQLFFCNSGIINYMTPIEKLLKKNYVVDMGYNFKKGDFIPRRENASQRAGYIIITGKNEKEIKINIKKVYEEMIILNENKENLVIQGKRWYR